MAVTFVVVPQWQGSSSSRAMRLVDGAAAIRGDLPSASTRTVEVPLEAGDAQGTPVHRLSSIALVRDRLTETLESVSGAAITIGGDCGVELGAIGRVLDDDVAVLWIDAHPDVHTPESSGSGAFHGMVLRTLLGDGPEQLVPPVPLPAARLVFVGVRAPDTGEDAFVEASGIRSVSVDDVSGQSLIAAVEATGAASVYVHIDLDVLDPGDFSGLGFPEPFGIPAGVLVDAIKGLLARYPLAGAGITEFAPASVEEAVEDMPTILRIIGALSSGS
jgi:arginase